MRITYDALTVLAQVSLEQQRKDKALPAAHNLLCRQVRVFTAVGDGHHGPYTRQATAAVEDQRFQDVRLHVWRWDTAKSVLSELSCQSAEADVFD